MKRILPALVILSFLVFPMVGLAQSRLEECTIKHTFNNPISDVYYGKNTTICASQAGTCAAAGACAGTEAIPSSGTCWTKDAPLVCTMDLIFTISDWIFVFVLVLAVIFVLLGAFQFITGGGEPEKLKGARSKLIYAAVGIAVAFLAKGIVRVIEMILA